MKKTVIAVMILCGISSSLYAAKLKLDASPRVKIFYNDSDHIGAYSHVVGVVDSVGTRELSDEREKEIGRSIQGKTKVLVRLTDAEGLMPGSVLYVINDRNLVVSKMSVNSVFKTTILDMMCVGYGNFRNSQKDFRVVRIENDEEISRASEVVAKGHYFKRSGDVSKAIEMYQKALLIDKKNPEAHCALGYIYIDQKMMQFAVKEFDEAYGSIGRVYDREERYLLLKGCTEARYYGAFFSELAKGHPVRNKYIQEGIRFAHEGLAVYPESVELNYYTGMFYYELSGSDAKLDIENDMKVFHAMQNVIKLKPDHIDAFILIAKIYKKHNNKEKAEKYASKALAIDPSRKDLRELHAAILKMK